MARIRTIKPDFWSDSKIVELTPLARLFFVGLWNFSDDSGNVEYSTKQLKLRILPVDNCDIDALTEELMAQELVLKYEVESKKYLHIYNFTKHQVINRPSKSRTPPPPKSKRLTEDSLTEGKGSGSGSGMEGKEGKGKDLDLCQLASNAHDDGANGKGIAPDALPLPAPGQLTPEELIAFAKSIKLKANTIDH